MTLCAGFPILLGCPIPENRSSVPHPFALSSERVGNLEPFTNRTNRNSNPGN